MNDILNIDSQVSTLYEKIARLIEQARGHVAATANEVYAKYHIGQYIVEEEQNGLERATYGKNILKKLSERLTKHFGDGWSYESLKLCRRFYVMYSNSANGVYPIRSEKEKQCLPNSEAPKFVLSWSHYLILMRIENTDEQHFYVDLVFYNRMLQCYVLIDLKTDKLTHQDLGLMQMYVNYYDHYVKQEFEKPTIGILLCERKNNALVELTLPKDANIYVSAYQLYLPDKALLQAKVKVKEWIAEFEEGERQRIGLTA